jgi:hypothetical protein
MFGVPIVGVAKTRFRGAARLVGAMAGRHRLPDALRRVDSLARGGPRDE